MIFVSRAIPINQPGQPHLDRDAVWDGLLQKANNALPFVPAISACQVIQRFEDGSFDREVTVRGDTFVERIHFEPQHRVVFTRIAGPVLGTIANEIEGEPGASDDDLQLRFSFALVVADVPGSSNAEKEFAETMTGDYLKGVEGTLTALRKIAIGDVPEGN